MLRAERLETTCEVATIAPRCQIAKVANNGDRPIVALWLLRRDQLFDLVPTETVLEVYLDKRRRVRMAEMREQRRSPPATQSSPPEESKEP